MTYFMWFQHSGATPLIANEIVKLLETTFNGRGIARNPNVAWISKSCDMTSLDYFFRLCG